MAHLCMLSGRVQFVYSSFWRCPSKHLIVLRHLSSVLSFASTGPPTCALDLQQYVATKAGLLAFWLNGFCGMWLKGLIALMAHGSMALWHYARSSDAALKPLPCSTTALLLGRHPLPLAVSWLRHPSATAHHLASSGLRAPARALPGSAIEV